MCLSCVQWRRLVMRLPPPRLTLCSCRTRRAGNTGPTRWPERWLAFQVCEQQAADRGHMMSSRLDTHPDFQCCND
jgi:hypothetical protein